MPVTEVTAGDRLKVGWVSGNQGGGYVRLALVPESDAGDAANFDRYVSAEGAFVIVLNRLSSHSVPPTAMC